MSEKERILKSIQDFQEIHLDREKYSVLDSYLRNTRENIKKQQVFRKYTHENMMRIQTSAAFNKQYLLEPEDQKNNLSTHSRFVRK